MPVDQLQLNFNPDSIRLLNFILGLVMFGVALDLKFDDFKRLAASPVPPLIGLFAQFLLLPALSFLWSLILNPLPSIALGMMLIAACPGGNVSNFLTHLAGGNTALSVSMTAISTAVALVMTPINLTFWGRLNANTSPILQHVNLDPREVFYTIVIILGIPLFAGMMMAHHAPKITARLRPPLKIFSIAFFVVFILIAFAMNWDNFLAYVPRIWYAVLIQNALALSGGYAISRLFRLPRRDARAISIETGIQNSALGLALIFQFFAGLGGMALVAAWWGIWHLISGLSLAMVWSKRPV
ncbi:MAG: bile acid:sodium symporter family protein [candidate division KSB1 bacterium]|nr:bile acid:sodium symporter family protein [candidate division KSB1 bacterium]MDZ7368246.1 bile acid:sodium symporter family protein [candidate division KSB1 bacterium]MDZ7406772.1 bile acid:sodium symporter family protein [candidate division KSB1 bacterium]